MTIFGKSWPKKKGRVAAGAAKVRAKAGVESVRLSESACGNDRETGIARQ